MKLNLSDFTKNDYKNAKVPTRNMLVSMGWSWSLAGKVARDYTAFDIEEAIKMAKFQAEKQGKKLVTPPYIIGILKNKPYAPTNIKT